MFYILFTHKYFIKSSQAVNFLVITFPIDLHRHWKYFQNISELWMLLLLCWNSALRDAALHLVSCFTFHIGLSLFMVLLIFRKQIFWYIQHFTVVWCLYWDCEKKNLFLCLLDHRYKIWTDLNTSFTVIYTYLRWKVLI